MQPSDFKRYAVVSAATAAFALLAGPAQAVLQDRDLNGDTVVDAFYDTDLDITWLRDANVNGPMTWSNAVAWADAYSIGAFSDWRLPTSDLCIGYNCSGEMGHLWYVELGNTAGLLTNAGSFQKLQFSLYWSGTEYAPGSIPAWHFYASTGYQDYRTSKSNALYAMAVRPGDVPAVPEPQTYALMLLGLGAVALAKRRRSR